MPLMMPVMIWKWMNALNWTRKCVGCVRLVCSRRRIDGNQNWLQRSSRTATPVNRKPQPNHTAGSGQNYDRVISCLVFPHGLAIVSGDLRIVSPECVATGSRVTVGVLKLGRVRSTPLSCSQPSATLQPRSACQSGLFWRCHTLRVWQAWFLVTFDLVSKVSNIVVFEWNEFCTEPCERHDYESFQGTIF